MIVAPVSAGAAHATSRAGSVGSLNPVRVTEGVPGLPASTSVTLMLTLITGGVAGYRVLTVPA